MKKKGIDYARTLDIVAPAIPLAHAFGRVGCFLAGCCYGRVGSGIWSTISLQFPRVIDRQGNIIGSFVYLDHLHRGLVTTADAWSLPVIPTQLLEVGANLIIVATLLLVERRKLRPGSLSIIYVLMYSCMRFCIEFLRGDAERGLWFGVVSTSQIITALAFACALGFIVFRYTRERGKS